MHTMTNAQIEKHLAPRMGRYVGTRKGGESCSGSVPGPESANAAREAARLLGAHFVTWTPDAVMTSADDAGMEPADESVRRNAAGRLAPRG